MTHVVRALVLGMRDVREWDRIYTLYTQERGLVRARAMGARKGSTKLGNHLLPFCVLRCFLIQARWVPKIGGVEQETWYAGIGHEVERLALASTLNELVSLTAPEGVADREAFTFLCGAYAWIDRLPTLLPDRWRLAQRFLAVQWLMRIGIGPAVERCVNCETVPKPGEPIWLSVAAGGLVCQSCHKAEPMAFADAKSYTEETWAALRYLSHAPLETLLGPALQPLVKEIAPLYQQFVSYHVDRDVKSVRVFDALIA